MSLSVSYNQNFNNGIDTTAIREITQQIFQKANTQNSVLANADLTKFNRVTLGTDLYSGRVDASTANQIAMTKVDMNVNLSQNTLNSLKYLNSQASKTALNNVDGKINISEAKEITEKKQAAALPLFGRLTETADLGSDKKGSNPFYKGELLSASKKEESEEILNVLA